MKRVIAGLVIVVVACCGCQPDTGRRPNPTPGIEVTAR